MFNYSFLGYTATPDEAIRIIHETGFFYLIICLAYLLSFIFLYNQSQAIRDKKTHHLVSILSWGMLSIALFNNIAPRFLSIVASFTAAMALLSLLRLAPLLTKIDFLLPSLNLKLKSHRLFKELQEKKKIFPDTLYSCSLINEYILWVLILYRSLITFRAALML